MGYELPDAFLLHVAGTSFNLGEPLSSTAAAAADKAWEFLQDLLSQDATDWGQRLAQAA